MLVVALCMSALQLVNMVRSIQYSEQVVGGTMHMIAESLKRDPSMLRELSALLDADISLHSFDDLANHLDDYDMSRIQRDQVLMSLSQQDSSISMIKALPRTPIERDSHKSRHAVEVVLSAFTDIQAQAAARMLIMDYRYSGMTIDNYIETMQPLFGFDLNVVELGDVYISESDRARLDYGDVLVRLSIESRYIEVIAHLPSVDKLLILGPVDSFNAYSWPVVLLITCIGILLIGLTVYWVVHSLEFRLRKLEQATGRLAQGHLNARVAVSSSEDSVSHLGSSFNKMAEHIQRLMSVQREMIRAVSHELRTPVARIRFGVQIIEDSITDNPFVSQQLKGMDADIQELDELVDEILTYARLEDSSPSIGFKPIVVADLAKQVVEEARPKKALRITFVNESEDPEELVEAEPRYIHRAIQNLVGNACRYAAKQVQVRYVLSEDVCRVDVDDDGSGIPEDQWESVFNAFSRLDDSRTRSSGGYGLGLSIVRRIAYWHNGQALVSRSPLGGARFSLIWPRQHEGQ